MITTNINGYIVRYQEMSQGGETWVRLWIEFGYCDETMIDIDDLSQASAAVEAEVKARNVTVRELTDEREDQ